MGHAVAGPADHAEGTLSDLQAGAARQASGVGAWRQTEERRVSSELEGESRSVRRGRRKASNLLK